MAAPTAGTRFVTASPRVAVFADVVKNAHVATGRAVNPGIPTQSGWIARTTPSAMLSLLTKEAAGSCACANGKTEGYIAGRGSVRSLLRSIRTLTLPSHFRLLLILTGHHGFPHPFPRLLPVDSEELNLAQQYEEAGLP